MNFAILREKVDHFAVETFVNEIAVEVVELAHRLLVLGAGQTVGQRGNLRFEFGDAIGVSHWASQVMFVRRAVNRFRP
jgi:hypothetical protein